MSLFVFFISLLIVAQHVSGNHVLIIRSWRLRDVVALCWYVPWLQEGGQVRLVGSASYGWQPATRIPPQPSHTETPTHIETSTHDQCGDSIEKSQAPDDGCINVRNMLNIEEVQ